MSRPMTLTMTAGGRLEIPEGMRQTLGMADGGRLLARVEDGVLILETIGSAIRRAQAMVGLYVPESVNLVDDLIADRRAEALKDDG